MCDTAGTQEIIDWFAERGFALGPAYWDGEYYWVDVEAIPQGGIPWRRYGRGESELDAARSARRRFIEEQ
jgi:hypothetical protein